MHSQFITCSVLLLSSIIQIAARSVPLGGNAFITTPPAGNHAVEFINSDGLQNWRNTATVTSVYFRMASAGSVTVGLNASLPFGSTNSTVKVTINGTPFNNVQLAGRPAKVYKVGTVNVPAPGYVRVDLQGVAKKGGSFGLVSALDVNTTSAITFANITKDEGFYFSRRGPSVHMNYAVPPKNEYFYNEVTVPVGEDPIGSYFMVAGFDGGYAGIQVKSATERWVIFSVWNPTKSTRNTTLVSKGTGVADNSFTNEGSGGHTHLVFDWKAGQTYKFITRVRPDGNTKDSLYSAWFAENNKWRYMATFRRPDTHSYQAGVHSFLENFLDARGYLGRRVLYNNQWARNTTVNGTWTEVTAAVYTGDVTAINAQRMDYAGGVENNQFYLRNGGFFNKFVALNQRFVRPPTGQTPTVNVSALPVM